VGYIPFDPEAANLMFSLVSNRYERASLIVTSNEPFSTWGEIFGDVVVAAAMIDRLVHHAEIVSLRGDSTASKTKTSAAPQPPKPASPADPRPGPGRSVRPTGSTPQPGPARRVHLQAEQEGSIFKRT
jgi:IstB-like ATP binding protein